MRALDAIRSLRRIGRSVLARRRAFHAHVLSVGPAKGLKFCTGLAERDYATGDNEIPVQEAIASELHPGGIFYDIGANVGFLTVLAARLVGPTGHVYALEPVPANVRFIHRNLKVNALRNVAVLPVAASSDSGRRVLRLAEYSGGSALDSVEAPPDTIGSLEVDAVSIDDLILNGKAKPPTFVKIDVEGAEHEVLQGMSATLKGYRPHVLYELDGPADDAIQPKSEACERLLRMHRYEVSRLPDSYPGHRWKVRHYIARP
jgi:FkbM family methyltransferase